MRQPAPDGPRRVPSQEFLMSRAQAGDGFALEQLYSNALPVVAGQVEVYLQASERRDMTADLPVEPDDLIAAGLGKVPKLVTGYRSEGPDSLGSVLRGWIDLGLLDEVRSATAAIGLSRPLYRALKEALESETPQAGLHALVASGFVEAPQFVRDSQISAASLSLDALLAKAQARPGARKRYPEQSGQINGSPVLVAATDVEREVIGTSNDERVYQIGESLDELPEVQRRVIIYKYGLFGVEPQGLAEIGAREGFIESRASQVHTAALGNLRKLMHGEPLEIAPSRKESWWTSLPKNLGQLERLERIHDKLNTSRGQRLASPDVDAVLAGVPDWQSSHAYAGVDKITVLTRSIPATLPVGTLAAAVPESEGLLDHQAGTLSLEVRNITGQDLQALLRLESQLVEAASTITPEQAEILSRLTPKQKKILPHLFKSPDELGLQLGVTPSTIRSQTLLMREQLGFTLTEDMAVFAARKKLIDLDTIPAEKTTQGLKKAERNILQNFYNTSYKAAAQALGLSPYTVRAHWHNIYSKTGTYNRLQASLVALRDGLIPMDETSAPAA